MMILLGIAFVGIILKWMGYLTFTKGGKSPLHIQFTILGYGITIADPTNLAP